MSLLGLVDVSKSFGGVRALQNVGFQVMEGEILGIMGANGAGKTTLFSLIAGNLRPSGGRIQFDGHAIHGMRPDRISRLGIARTFQIVRPFGEMSVLENVKVGAMYGARREGKAAAEARAGEILEELGLARRAAALASSLTIADRKRLEIARALATGPKLLLLDEVMAGLTASEVAAALEMLRMMKTRHGLTILVIEHVMRALMRLCNRIIVLHHGQLIAEGTPQAVSENPTVISAYLGDGG